MSDNPFDEPVDQDRTVIRPAPGGRRAPMASAASPPAIPATPMMAAPVGTAISAPALGDNKLLHAAAPLLQLLARLRNSANPPDAGDLRARVLQELKRFEKAARDAAIPMELLRPAHFALCSSLDDVVLNTPWGASSAWARSTLVASFHPTLDGPDRFEGVLGQMRQNISANLWVVELTYYCLSLGYMGRFRQARGGAEALTTLRTKVAAEIAAARPPASRELSPNWQGVAAPFRPRRRAFPIWVVLAVALALVGAMFAFSLSDINRESDAVTTQALQIAPTRMPDIARAGLAVPPPPAPSGPSLIDVLQTALAPQVKSGAVTVEGTPTTPVLRIPTSVLFAAGTAKLSGSASALLTAITEALRAQPGRIEVLGYTDNTPMHSIQFPSNFQFSAARAKAVQAALQRGLHADRAVWAEGRAEADPVAANSTAQGRAQNARIEIVLHGQEAAQ